MGVYTMVAKLYIFKQKIPIWYILEGLEMEKVGIFYEQFQYIASIGIYILMACW
jgi:hypothetical protein